MDQRTTDPQSQCPSFEVLVRFVGGSLDDENTQTQRHVEHCIACLTVVGDLADDTEPDLFAGRYELYDCLGQGAFGMVFRAWDTLLERNVAIKKNRDRAHQRSVTEARALAKLRHPNVVAVFDTGISDDESFVAMELVNGQSLDKWSRTARARGKITQALLQAARGVATAHRQGVLHRDLKPANILVEAEGRVVVADFGLAIATVCAPDGHAPPAAGTLAYMAPELLRGGSATTSSDAFAFGVTVWEAYVGTRPFEGPTRESLLSAIESSPSSLRMPPEIPASIRSVLRSSLDPRPDQRPSLDSFVTALSRRRQRTRYLFALPVALGLFAWWLASPDDPTCEGAADHLTTAWGDARQSAVYEAFTATALPLADTAWQDTSQALDRYRDGWVQMHTQTCEATSVRHEQTPAVMDLRMACLGRARVKFAAISGVLAQEDPGIVINAAKLVEGLLPLTRCADLAYLLAEVEPPTPGDAEAVEHIRGHVASAFAHHAAGRFDLAMLDVKAGQSLLPKVNYEPVAIELQLRNGTELVALGRHDEAEQTLRNTLRRAVRGRRWNITFDVVIKLMRLLRTTGHHAEAMYYQDFASGLAYDDIASARLHKAIGLILQAQGHSQAAEVRFRKQLALLEGVPDSLPRWRAAARGDLAIALRDLGKFAESELQQRAALELEQQALGARHPNVAESHAELARILGQQLKLEEAEQEIRSALSIRKEALGPAHINVSESLRDLGLVLHFREQYAAAVDAYRRALTIAVAANATPRVESDIRGGLGSALLRDGKIAEASVELRKAVTLLEQALRPGHPAIGGAHNNLAIALEEAGDIPAAESHYRQALALIETGPDNHRVARARLNLAKLLVDRGAATEAAQLAEAAWAKHRGEDTPAQVQAETSFLLARALWDASTANKARRRALTLTDSAIEILERVGTANGFGDTLAEARAWKGSHRLEDPT